MRIFLCFVTSLIVITCVLTVCESVERYVGELHREDQAGGEGVYAVPTGAHVKDNEQVP